MSQVGVYFSKGNNRWRATLSGYGNRGYIGEFVTREEACAARFLAEMLIDGRLHDVAEIRIDGDEAYVPVWGARGVLVGWVRIDAEDVEKVCGVRWCMTDSGYAVARSVASYLYLHRVIMPGGEVADHVDGDKMHCRKVNLRRCTQIDNSRNSRKPKNNTTGFKGVVRTRSGRFSAHIMVDRRGIYLGTYDDAESAAVAYDHAAVQHFGEFARPNRVEAFMPQVGE